MSRKKDKFAELERALRQTTPPPTAVPDDFQQQLRGQLQAEAAAVSRRPTIRRRVLAFVPILLLAAAVALFWFSSRTAVSPEANPQPTAMLKPGEDEAIRRALIYGSWSNKAIGGRLLEPLEIEAVYEPYETAVRRLGSRAVASYQGSNILFQENRAEFVWFVQVKGRWAAYTDLYGDGPESIRYFAALINPETNRVAAAGSSTVPFLDLFVTLSLADYPPGDMPYRIEPEGFWLVHTDEALLAFDPLAPVGDLFERCRYLWVPVNGRFTDPCSGDEWELDGRLNLQHSSELWSRRNLDQYGVELQGETIIVHLDEIIRGQQVVDEPQ